MRVLHQGFVLLIVLIFLNLFSLASLYSLTAASNTLKSTHHLWQGFVFRLECEKILQKLEVEIMQHPACIIPVIPSPVLAKKPPSWWQLNTCHGMVDGIQYDYAVEVLGEDACAVMNDQTAIARYYRITLKSGRYFLQSTAAFPVASSAVCNEKLHTVTKGRQALREL